MDTNENEKFKYYCNDGLHGKFEKNINLSDKGASIKTKLEIPDDTLVRIIGPALVFKIIDNLFNKNSIISVPTQKINTMNNIRKSNTYLQHHKTSLILK